MQKQYSVEYVGAPNLPSGGLEYRLPKIGKVLAGKRKLVFLTDDRYADARKLPGLEVKPGPVESAQQVDQRFRKLFGGIADAAKLPTADREASETQVAKAIAKISEDEAKTGARLRKLVASLALGARLWNAQDALTGIEGAAEAKRQETLARFALEVEQKAAARTETVAARPTVEALVTPELPAEPKTKSKKRGLT